jgi:hypothetical protein
MYSRTKESVANPKNAIARTVMAEPTITCPNCKSEIKLTESLAAPLLEATRKDFEQRLATKDAEVGRRETLLREQHASLAKDRGELEAMVEQRVVRERDRIAEEEAAKARRLLNIQIADKDKQLAELNDVLKDRDVKLGEAQKAQADLVRKQRELDDARREVELTVETRVQESIAGVRDKARKEAEESLGLKVREKEETINAMQRQIEELKRKAEQGSQQLQGEVQELALEAMLRAKFPRDNIDPVPKGEYGGDVLQSVIGASGQPCGTILWEIKRTKNWSDAWLSKLRDDQRAAKADVALLVSQALPKEVHTFDLVDGVWVAESRCAIPVAIALRESLISLAGARQASEGQMTKMELMYQYLMGPRFRHRVEAIVEKFTDMQDDLDRERKATTRLWAKREEQIRGVIEATAGMYGDLQGIAGKTLREIEGLEVPLLDSPSENSQ